MCEYNSGPEIRAMQWLCLAGFRIAIVILVCMDSGELIWSSFDSGVRLAEIV
jgi:hypothetical protein